MVNRVVDIMGFNFESSYFARVIPRQKISSKIPLKRAMRETAAKSVVFSLGILGRKTTAKAPKTGMKLSESKNFLLAEVKYSFRFLATSLSKRVIKRELTANNNQ